MTQELLASTNTPKTSRRNFIQVFTAASTVCSAASLLLTGCPGQTPQPAPAQPKAVGVTPKGVDTDKHRAFLTLWLLLTTNPNWISGLCTSIDYDGLSKDLGGHLSSTDIKTVFSFASNNLGVFAAVGKLFNDTVNIKPISGYVGAPYDEKTCPTTMKEAMSLFTPVGSLTFHDPTCPLK